MATNEWYKEINTKEIVDAVEYTITTEVVQKLAALKGAGWQANYTVPSSSLISELKEARRLIDSALSGSDYLSSPTNDTAQGVERMYALLIERGIKRKPRAG